MKKTEKTFWNKEIETMSGEAMRELQTARLKKQLRYNFSKSLFYREKFGEAGLHPDDIKCLEDLQNLPLTTKDDLRRIQQGSIATLGHP